VIANRYKSVNEEIFVQFIQEGYNCFEKLSHIRSSDESYGFGDRK
jgi:hypothetical protein